MSDKIIAAIETRNVQHLQQIVRCAYALGWSYVSTSFNTPAGAFAVHPQHYRYLTFYTYDYKLNNLTKIIRGNGLLPADVYVAPTLDVLLDVIDPLPRCVALTDTVVATVTATGVTIEGLVISISKIQEIANAYLLITGKKLC